MDAISKSLFWSFCIGALFAVFVQNGMAMDSPDAIELSTLANRYEPVAFDHSMHRDMASCATCHHHTTGTPPVDEHCAKCHKNSGPSASAACAACHPANPCDASEKLQGKDADVATFHLEIAGLKRAYHINCLGCHQEMGAPTGCDDCHAKREIGPKVTGN